MILNIETVRQAYERHGYTPTPCILVDASLRQACPLAMMYIAMHVGPVDEDSITRWANSMWGAKWVDEFTAGFDGDRGSGSAFRLGAFFRCQLCAASQLEVIGSAGN